MKKKMNTTYMAVSYTHLHQLIPPDNIRDLEGGIPAGSL